MRFIRLFLVLLMGITASNSFAGVTKVTIKVDGMACPFCAYNIEKRIKTLDGVPDEAGFDASVEHAEAKVNWQPTVPFSPGSVRQQIKRAGFTPGGIEATAFGQLVQQEQESWAVYFTETDQTITLQRGEQVTHQASFDALQHWVKSHPEGKLTVHGQVLDGAPWALALHRWSPAVFQSHTIIETNDLACENCALNVTKVLRALADVIHAEADPQQDRVWIWSQAQKPDTPAYQQAIEQAGFQVKQIHKQEPLTEAR